ncbi:MAG: hypothetical protein IJH14_06530 [Solobacterium sp.]|nr:hypothetical protein [Solobacterium sp.]
MSDQDYDIQEAFRRIELELIASMKRNLSKHKEWETKEGINWNMWQAEQLKDMRRFQQQNEKIFGKRFAQINNRVQNLLKETAGLQDFEQERQSLEEMINNPSLSRSSSEAISGGFFGINDRRMMALIKSTGNDLKKAEHAMLRMTNDQYRKVIFNAQTYFNSGAGTLDKAIDMATDEFLKRGINCIEYKDGRRVNIATYAEMALRTANKRAGLMADGDKRAAMGIHLVKISSYGACSPTCMPWQGRIYVDDVYSGGTKEEAKKLGYPLLSKAMEGGLFHPNCRHTASTYYPGLDLNDTGNPRDDSKTMDLKEHPDAERYHNYYQNLIQREKRLQVGSLDEAKIREHADREAELVGLDKKVVREIETERPHDSNLSKNSEFTDTPYSIEELKTDLTSIMTVFRNTPSISRDEITKMFKPIYLLGNNPITGKNVIVKSKDVSYFIDKHFREGSLTEKMMLQLCEVLNYDILLKDDRISNGYIFIKKANSHEGYLDGVTKPTVNGDELFHFQYRGMKKTLKRIKKAYENGNAIYIPEEILALFKK